MEQATNVQTRTTETQRPRQFFFVALWLCALMACLMKPAPADAQAAETIAEIRVHGNHATPDADIVALTGLTVGEPATTVRLRAAEEKLRASGRFAGVEIRRRYRSLTASNEILIVLVVDEHPGATRTNLTPGPMARMRHATMWLPLFRYSEGYGVTFGARVSAAPFGPRSRVSVPLTWGGERRAAVDVERAFDRGPLTGARASASVSRSVNPHFAIPESRRSLSASAERRLAPWLRAEGAARLSRVLFGESRIDYPSAGVYVTGDTRLDPMFPRNAVYLTTAIEALGLASPVLRASADVRAFIGIGGAAVLAVRAKTVKSSAPLPPFEQTLVGGGESLRGYRAGHLAGDNAAVMSAEARWPFNSPLSFARFGIKTFVDVGTTWAAGDRLARRRFDRGAGIGAYAGGPAVTAGLDVAWPHRARTPAPASESAARWHFALAVSF